MKQHTQTIAIIGAGPAGLMAAISAAECGSQVLLFDHLSEPGKKLLVTGGGRCNLTHLASDDELMQAFGKYGRFMQPALAALNPEALCRKLESIGIPTCIENNCLVFPKSHSAKEVRQRLWGQCHTLGVKFHLNTQVKAILKTNNQCSGIETDHDPLSTHRIIMATGGKSYPELGADGSGYELAKELGHTITPLHPALVGLLTEETWPGQLAGVSLQNVEIRLTTGRKKTVCEAGDLLFTHRGISGPAILNISGAISEDLAKESPVGITINWFFGKRAQDWEREIKQWRQKEGTKTILRHLSRHMPVSLAEQLCSLSNIAKDTITAQLREPASRTLIQYLTQTPLTITQTEGFSKAMITRGGISLKEINPHTMESKEVKGLFFAGEVVDLDGPCGGYNLQWAFSSGRLAGQSAAT